MVAVMWGTLEHLYQNHWAVSTLEQTAGKKEKQDYVYEGSVSVGRSANREKGASKH